MSFAKKRIVIFILILSSIASLACCSQKGISVDDIAYRLLNLYSDIPPCSQYVKNARQYTSGYISPEDFSFLYTGVYQKLPEWDMIEEFRLIMSGTTDSFEIHIIKAVSSSDSDEISKLLSRRIKLLSSHNHKEEDFPAKEPILYTEGRYVILLATSDNNSAVKLLKKLL